MITGVHIILTYKCNFECDHCFLYCSPNTRGTFTVKQISEVLTQVKRINSVKEIFFEGGEPFLFYPLLLEGIKQASSMGFKVGIVTNAYGANSREDAELWIKPLIDAGLSRIQISNDEFHYDDTKENPATIAYSVSKELGIEITCISVDKPKLISKEDNKKGIPIVEGSVRLRGRAVEKFVKDLPSRPWQDMKECPYEDLKDPSRIHVDPYGYVHICQGIIIGNIWKTPLYDIMKDYDPNNHPICGPITKGGPAKLLEELNIDPEIKCVDECHLCFLLRKKSINKYPDYLAPKQVYGL